MTDEEKQKSELTEEQKNKLIGEVEDVLDPPSAAERLRRLMISRVERTLDGYGA